MRRQTGAGEVCVMLGAAVPPADAARLKAAGVPQVFGPGSALKDIVEFVRQAAARGGAATT